MSRPPKARPKGVVDGKQVNIPVLGVTAKGGTEKAMLAGATVVPV